MKKIRQSDAVLGSRVRESMATTPRRGTVVGIYTDVWMREEVLNIRWDISRDKVDGCFASQIRRIT